MLKGRKYYKDTQGKIETTPVQHNSKFVLIVALVTLLLLALMFVYIVQKGTTYKFEIKHGLNGKKSEIYTNNYNVPIAITSKGLFAKKQLTLKVFEGRKNSKEIYSMPLPKELLNGYTTINLNLEGAFSSSVIKSDGNVREKLSKFIDTLKDKLTNISDRKYITFKIYDRNGKILLEQSYTLIYDNEAPKLTNKWFLYGNPEQVKLTLKFSENASITYKCKENAECELYNSPLANSYELKVAVKEPKKDVVLEYSLKDLAGNESKSEITVRWKEEREAEE